MAGCGMGSSNIIIGGLVPFTTIDYPKKVSLVLFLQGCPWRCVYCSNPHLFEFSKVSTKDRENWEYVLELLKKRVKMLDAVVFSGGEATSQAEEVIKAIDDIRKISKDFKIGLHTNGCHPEKLRALLPYVDWIGMDIKAPIEKYDAITGVKDSGKNAFASLGLIMESGKDFEVRTTADPTVLTKDDIIALAQTLAEKGVKTYALQRYRPVDKANPKNPPMSDIMQFFMDDAFKARLEGMFESLSMRS
jgi:anaerobic ribonucleoside-triphosphate reductase activating protein